MVVKRDLIQRNLKDITLKHKYTKWNIDRALIGCECVIGRDRPSSQCPALKTEDHKHSLDG